MFSFDTDRDAIVVREFLLEGSVHTYVCDLDAAFARLSCESKAGEGTSQRTLRLRYEFGDREHFTEAFEVLGADGAVRVRIEGQWVRTGERG